MGDIVPLESLMKSKATKLRDAAPEKAKHGSVKVPPDINQKLDIIAAVEQTEKQVIVHELLMAGGLMDRYARALGKLRG